MNLFQIKIIRKDTRASWQVTPTGDLLRDVSDISESLCFADAETALLVAMESIGLDGPHANIQIEMTMHNLTVSGWMMSQELDLTRCKIERIRNYDWEWLGDGPEGQEWPVLEALRIIDEDIVLEPRDQINLVAPYLHGKGAYILMRKF